MKYIPLGTGTVMGVRVFVSKEGHAFPDEPFAPEKWARDLIASFEDEACVALLEAISDQALKAINRHADWCGQGNESFWENPPEWATKYKAAGL